MPVPGANHFPQDVSAALPTLCGVQTGRKDAAYLRRVVPLGGGEALRTRDEVALGRRVCAEYLHAAVREEPSRVEAIHGVRRVESRQGWLRGSHGKEGDHVHWRWKEACQCDGRRRGRGEPESQRTFDSDEPQGDPPDRPGQSGDLYDEGRQFDRDPPALSEYSAHQDPGDDVEDTARQPSERKGRNTSCISQSYLTSSPEMEKRATWSGVAGIVVSDTRTGVDDIEHEQVDDGLPPEKYKSTRWRDWCKSPYNALLPNLLHLVDRIDQRSGEYDVCPGSRCELSMNEVLQGHSAMWGR